MTLKLFSTFCFIMFSLSGLCWCLWSTWSCKRLVSINLFVFFYMELSSLTSSICCRCFFSPSVYCGFFIKNVCGFMSKSSTHFHWSICLVFVPIPYCFIDPALWNNLKSGMVIPSVVFSLFMAVLTVLYLYFHMNLKTVLSKSMKSFTCNWILLKFDFIMERLFPSIESESFAVYTSLIWHLGSLRVYRIFVCALLIFHVSTVILISLPLYVAWSFFLATFNIFFLLHV